MSLHVQFENYSPVGDLTVFALCGVMIILMIFSYIQKTRSFRIFATLIGLILGAALADVAFYTLVAASRENPGMYPVACAVRCVYHALLFFIFLDYVLYITEVTHMERRKKLPFIVASVVVLVAVVAADVIDTLRGNTFTFDGTRIEYIGRDIFMYGYLAFLVMIIMLVISVRKRLFNRVMRGFYGTMAVSFFILFMQGMKGQSSFTVATFFFPVIAMFYIMHSNPYDAELGAIDSRAMEDEVRYCYEKKRGFVFISLYMRAFSEENKEMPEQLRASVRRFTSDFFRGATLFQVGKGHMILMFSKSRNPGYESGIHSIIHAFRVEYQRYKYDYKIVYGESVDEISRKNEYASFIRSRSA